MFIKIIALSHDKSKALNASINKALLTWFLLCGIILLPDRWSSASDCEACWSAEGRGRPVSPSQLLETSVLPMFFVLL